MLKLYENFCAKKGKDFGKKKFLFLELNVSVMIKFRLRELFITVVY